MFEKIVIRRNNNRQLIDPGAFAETLLFYDNVHLLLDRGSLDAVLRAVGADNLLQLIKDKRVTATILTDHLGAHTNTPLGGKPVHDFGTFSLAQHADGRKFKRKHIVEESFASVLGDNKMSRIKAERLLSHVSFRRHDENPDSEGALLKQARLDLEDVDYVREAVRETLLDKIPDLRLPHDWYFRAVRRADGQFTVATNLDFVAINAYPDSDNAISEAHLALSILEARADLSMAANYMSEIITDPARSKIIQIRFREMLERRTSSQESISTFQDAHLDNARAIREAINSGERSFDEFLVVLDKASKFRNWVTGLNPDAKILNEYYEEATRLTWVDKLPTKGTRFAICTIGGALLEALQPGSGGMALSAGLGAADLLFIDRILKGWRPNQFVNGSLKRFVDTT